MAPDGSDTGSNWATLFESLPIGAYRSSPEGRMLRANPALAALNGYASEAELLAAVGDIGREWYVDPLRRDEFRRLLARDGAVRGFVSEVYRHRTREPVWVSEHAVLVRDAQGEALHYEGTVEDITARVRRQRALELDKDQLRLISQQFPGVVYRTRVKMGAVPRFEFVSEGVRELYGVEPEELMRDGGLLQRMRHPDDGEAVGQALDDARARAAPHTAQFRIVRRDGQVRWVMGTTNLVSQGADGDVRTGVILDITAAREAEQALRDSDARWKLALESLGDGVWEWDFMRDEGLFSGPLREAYGLPPGAWGAPGRDLDARTHPDDVASMRAARQAHVEGRTPVYTHEHRIRRADGRWMWVLSRGLVVQRDAEGRPLRMIGTHTDITERREAEALRQQRDRAEAANQAKSELMSRVSHELRTPLNAVLGFAQLLAREAGLSARHQQWVAQILASGQHLLGLVDDVLELTRVQGLHFGLQLQAVDLGPAFDASWAMLAQSAGAAGLALDRPAAPLALRVQADPKRLRQVFINLLSNAVKYNRPGGRIGFEAEGRGPEVEFRITDSGRGIGPQDLERIFQPFERLGAEQDGVPGTGLGLALCRQLVDSMGGTISATSTPGVGSCFTVRLPAAAG